MNISGSSVDSSEGALIKSLFTNYDKDVKPTTAANGIVDIEFKFYLTRIESLVSNRSFLCKSVVDWNVVSVEIKSSDHVKLLTKG